MRTKSFLRREQYKALSRLKVDGTILDVGGSKKSGYHELLKGNHTIITGNIDEGYGIDILFDAEKKWPFDEASFDGVLLVNILEHLFEHKFAVEESFRVLRQHGTIAGVVPFMFNVHGSPSDYFRYTRFALERLLKEAGFTSVRVEELGTGAFSVMYHAMLSLVRFTWLADVLIPLCGGIDRVLSYIKPNNRMSARYMPLGYYFEAKK